MLEHKTPYWIESESEKIAETDEEFINLMFARSTRRPVERMPGIPAANECPNRACPEFPRQTNARIAPGSNAARAHLILGRRHPGTDMGPID